MLKRGRQLININILLFTGCRRNWNWMLNRERISININILLFTQGTIELCTYSMLIRERISININILLFTQGTIELCTYSMLKGCGFWSILIIYLLQRVPTLKIEFPRNTIYLFLPNFSLHSYGILNYVFPWKNLKLSESSHQKKPEHNYREIEIIIWLFS